MSLPELLERSYRTSLADAVDLSSQSINNSHLGNFIQVAKAQPKEVKKIAAIYIKNMEISSFNNVASLYALAKIADVSKEAKNGVSAALPEKFIEIYKENGDQDVANKAIILEKILSGAAMSDFQEKQSNQQRNSTTNTYNFSNIQNVALHSPGAMQSVEITNTDKLDDETRQLLVELKDAFDKQDKVSVKKIFGYIADKGVDVALALATGVYLR